MTTNQGGAGAGTVHAFPSVMRERASQTVGALWVMLGAAGLWSCGAATQSDLENGATTLDLGEGGADAPDLGEEELGATWQELGVPGATLRPALAGTPNGWLAVSQRSVGDSRAPSAWESYLYRSRNGVAWQRVDVSEDNTNLWLRGVAYGAGHYVLAGMRFGGGDGVILHSSDAERWEEISVNTGAPSGLADVVFANGRFFALSTFRTLLSSTDGLTWATVDLATTVMPLDVAFGQGQFLLVGSGDVQRSADGLHWQPSSPACTLVGACISDPDGNVLPGVHYNAVYTSGTFFIDQASSADGQTWQALPGLTPRAAVGGHVLGESTSDPLVVWKPGEAARALARVRYIDTLTAAERPQRLRWNGSIEPSELDPESFPNGAPLPDQIEFPIPGGADCSQSRCVLVGDTLYLTATAAP
jgi:hypothetical protein